VAVTKADKAIEYAGYAEHCLKIVAFLPDQEFRIIQREMAAEWIKLAKQAATEDAARGARAVTQPNGRKKAGA
jgi:hypothetical protein